MCLNSMYKLQITAHVCINNNGSMNKPDSSAKGTTANALSLVPDKCEKMLNKKRCQLNEPCVFNKYVLNFVPRYLRFGQKIAGA